MEACRMTSFIDRLAYMPLLLMSGAAGAGTVYVDCQYQIPAPPMVKIAPPVHVRARPMKHHHKRAAGHHGARTALTHRMCPVWLDEGTTNVSLGEDRDGYLDSGGSFMGGGPGDFDTGGDSGWGAGGGLGGGSNVQPDLFLITDYVAPLSPAFTPSCCGSTPIVAVPETSTCLMMVMGLFGMGWLKRRRA